MSAVTPEPVAGPRRDRDRRLAFLVTCFGLLVVATNVGSVMAPTLVTRSPELLLALSSRIRHLLFAVPAGIEPVWYVVIGFGRLTLAAVLCFTLGRRYGARGMMWIERQFGNETPRTFLWLQRAADRAGGPLVVFMPGSNIVCALVGLRGMRSGAFGAYLSLGIALRLAWVWVAARQFESQLKSALDWIEQYQWWLVGAFFLLTFVQSWRRNARTIESLDGDADTAEEPSPGT